MTGLGDPSAFLCDYWQKRPLVMRAALAGQLPDIDGDDLAGLACEPDVESRLVTGCTNRWQLCHGPFNEDDFAALPEQDWTLLVQAVDQHIAEVASLRRHFAFLPAWRIDDIMVSFAVAGGNVGPHFDQYDVFLLQGTGRREWRLGPRCDATTPMRDHPDLQLLAQFETETIAVLEPGDVLYLPPGTAHWGTALDDCLTFSVGLRAPSHAEVISGFCDHLLATTCGDTRYTDPELTQAHRTAEIDAATLAQLRAIVRCYADDDAALLDWFGRYVSEPKYPELFTDRLPEQRSMKAAGPLLRNLASRFAFHGDEHAAVLFVDGRRYDGAGRQWYDFSRRLSGDKAIDSARWAQWLANPAIWAVVDELQMQRSLLADETNS